jgi:hypothetical protein
MQDKLLLAGTTNSLKERTRELESLEWDHQVVQQRCTQVYNHILKELTHCNSFVEIQ